MSKEFSEALLAFGEAHTQPPDVDPNNPWPLGCDWWHKHNEIWRRRKAHLREITEQGGRDDG